MFNISPSGLRRTSMMLAIAAAATVGLTACDPGDLTFGAASSLPTASASQPDRLDAAAQRAYYNSRVTQRSSCDNGALTVAGFGEVVLLSADCNLVTISGTGVTVLAQHIGTLTITGYGVSVYASSINNVVVMGTSTVVLWDSGTPSIKNLGYDNKLQPAK